MARTLAERAAEIGHEGEVYRPHTGGRNGTWRPRCSCGYDPIVNTTKRDAGVYLNDHFRGVLADHAAPNSAGQP